MFKNAIDYLFNWKKNPKSVFLLAIPLFIIGMGSQICIGVIKTMQGDYGYAIIFALMSPLFYILYKAVKTLIKAIK
jgi:hypothetical protein